MTFFNISFETTQERYVYKIGISDFNLFQG